MSVAQPDGLERSCDRTGRLAGAPRSPSTASSSCARSSPAWLRPTSPRRLRHRRHRLGVQTFDYRGAVERRLAGEVVVLHPDEAARRPHGDERGFGYHLVYVEPARIADALAP